MKKQLILTLLIVLFSPLYSFSQTSVCNTKNVTFKSGEKLSYVIAYNWFVVYTEVGLADFTINNDIINGQKAYHFVGKGRTFNMWDSFFEVRDKYESWVTRDSLKPIYFERNNKDGNFTQNEKYNFIDDSIVIRKNRTYDNPFSYDTIPVTPCTYDVMSALLHTRNIDFSKVKVNDKIPVSIVLDDEVYNLYFRYLGLEDKKVKGLGTFKCRKFVALLVEGTIFHEGEDMLLWITNDQNHIPIYIQSPILIGSIKAYITKIEGNRYPLTSKIE
jgi:hypothetical protein